MTDCEINQEDSKASKRMSKTKTEQLKVKPNIHSRHSLRPICEIENSLAEITQNAAQKEMRWKKLKSH